MEFNATFLISIISFLVFTFIMNKIFYAPLEKIISERDSIINTNYADAENAKNQALSINNTRKDRISKTQKEAKKLISDKVNDANINSKNLTQEAKNFSQEKINSAKENLHCEAVKTTEELKSKVKDLAEIISTKVLRTETKIANNDTDLINRILN